MNILPTPAPMRGTPMTGTPMTGVPVAGAPIAGAPIARAPILGTPAMGARATGRVEEQPLSPGPAGTMPKAAPGFGWRPRRPQQPAATLRGWLTGHRLPVTAALGVVLFVGAILTPLMLYLRADGIAAEKATRQVVRVVTGALAGQLASRFDAVDQSLRTVAEALQRDPDLAELPLDALEATQAGEVALGVVDAQGRPLAFSARGAAMAGIFAGGPGPLALPLDDSRVLIGSPRQLSPGPGRPALTVVPLFWPLAHPAPPPSSLPNASPPKSLPPGAMAVAAWSLEPLDALYRGLDMGEGDSVTLLRRDGLLLTRKPPLPSLVGQPIDQVRQMMRQVTAQTGELRAASELDGIERFYAWSSLPRTGMFVLVGAARDRWLASWQQRVVLAWTAAGLVTVLAILFAVLATRSISQRARAEAAATRRLRLLTHASAAFAGAPDPNALAQAAAAIARRIGDAQQAEVLLPPLPGQAEASRAVMLGERARLSPARAGLLQAAGIPRRAMERGMLLQLTTEALAQHPAWRPLAEAAGLSPPLRGCMVMPLRDDAGEAAGWIAIADRNTGDFGSDDEAVLRQLVNLTEAALEQRRLVAEQRLAAEEARAAGARTDRVLEAISDGYLTLDAQWRVGYVNGAAQRLFGRSAQAMLGAVFWDLFPETRGTEIETQFRAAARGPEQSFLVEPPGWKMQIAMRAAAGPDGLTVYCRDVTAERDIERKLQLAQRMEAVGQLTGGVAHDFNNLLTVIMGNAELLTESLEDRPEMARAASLVLDASERGAELTRRLLAFARRQPLAPVAIDVAALLADLEPLLARSSGTRVRLEINTPPGLWLAEADESQLENAIINLAVNARDAMPDGGRLLIEAGNATLAQTHLAGALAGFGEASPGRFLRISVRDTGTGMTAEVKARAFEPFFTTKEHGRGTGLGLATIYGFVRQSGGVLQLDSAPGLGTCVEIYLPAIGPG